MTRQGGRPLDRACFDHHIGKGPGACIGAVSREQYAEDVARVIDFLEGSRASLIPRLEAEMLEASGALEFERAARLRNSIDAVHKVLERQGVVSERPLEVDVIGIVREETIAAAQVLLVREGRVFAGNEFPLDKGMDVPESELVEGFLLRYYGQTSYVPREVILSVSPEDPHTIEAWLTKSRGSKVRLVVPQRGEKRALLALANTNAEHFLARYKFRTRYDEERLNRALLELESALGLPAPPMRIECFDISTIHGRHSVGSMVVFQGGRPYPQGYRRFRVRAETPESNDVMMIGEVLRRRIERLDDRRFGSKPDLMIIDGGKPQLGAALAALLESGYDELPVAALAKREEELFVPGWEEPVRLPAGSSSLYLVKRIRDEAHRSAVTYHRELRSRAMTSSILDDIPGAVPEIPYLVAEDVAAVFEDSPSASSG